MATLKQGTVVTIGRMFGSRGREIGKSLAAKLGVAYYDRELLEEAAKKSGMSKDFVESFDEKPTNSFLYSIVMGTTLGYMGGNNAVSDQIYKAQVESVREIAQKAPCVIVGRRADRILRDDFDVVSVFISASEEARIAHVAEREGVKSAEAARRMKKADRERAAYYNFYSDGSWGRAGNYDLCLDSTHLTPDQAADVIVAYLDLTGRTE